MTAVTDYITVDQLRAYMTDVTARDPDGMQAAVTTASRSIDGACERYFSDDGATSVRYFSPRNWYEVDVDDFSTTTGLVVATDVGYDGTYSQTLTLNTHFFVEPVNQLVGGLPWPYTTLSAISIGASPTFLFPPPIQFARRPTVKVTARWGWTTVPTEITQAAKILAAEIYKLKDAPLGVAGYGEYGAIRVRENPKVRALIGPYMQNAVVVA